MRHALMSGAVAVVCWLGATAAVGAERAEPLARYFPRQDLVVYAEFDGLGAHDDAWKQTATARLLNQTTTGAMLEAVAVQLLDHALGAELSPKVPGKAVMTLAKHALRHGFAFGINRQGSTQKPTCVGFVVRRAAHGDARAVIDRLIKAGNAPATRSDSVAKAGGRNVTVVTDGSAVGTVPGPNGPQSGPPQGFAMWAEGDDLALSLVSPGGADAMIAALEGEQPSAVDHEQRRALVQREGTFEPIGLAFFEMSALPPLPSQAAALGLNGIRRFEYQWGLDGPALMTVTRVVAPFPRPGMLALWDQPAFDTRKLPPLPAGVDRFAVFSLAPAMTFEQLAALGPTITRAAPAAIDALERTFRNATGHRLREDVLRPLGPSMVAYNVATKVNAPTNVLEGLALGLAHVPTSVLMIHVNDAKAFGPVLDDLVKGFNTALRGKQEERPAAAFQPLKGHEHAYVLSTTLLPAGLKPTVLLGQENVIIATTPAAARQALGLETKAGGLPEDDALAKVIAQAPSRATYLAVTDTQRSLLPELVANLPALVQIAAARTQIPFFALVPTLRDLAEREEPVDAAPATVPDASKFRLAIDPNDVPAPDDLRPFLFPATFVMSTDQDGVRLVTRESFPALDPAAVAPIVAALVLPAIQATREVQRRDQATNNLKQIGLALHNFHGADNHMPAPIRDKSGKPLLSWRVAILPFLEQQTLFQEFHLDEPWDSPHNKELIERMPGVFAIPGAKGAPGQTFYRGFEGRGAFFDPTKKDGISVADVTDGTSNTIAIVEAREAVPWTKPDSEMPFDSRADRPEDRAVMLRPLGGHFVGGFHALLIDGSVRFIKESINPVTLRALITRDGGEVISPDSF